MFSTFFKTAMFSTLLIIGAGCAQSPGCKGHGHTCQTEGCKSDKSCCKNECKQCTGEKGSCQGDHCELKKS